MIFRQLYTALSQNQASQSEPLIKDPTVSKHLVSSINHRAKRLSLRVDHRAGVIKLSIPPHTPSWAIDRFINAQKNWIEDRIAALSPKIMITDGASIPFMGAEHIIDIKHHLKRTTDICACDNAIQIHTSRPDPTNNLKRWMIQQAQDVISPLAHQKAKTIGKTITKIDFRDPTSRWGSCSSDGRLMFSWRLIMTDPDILDYVVAHEVAHLTHMDHSKQFWDLCYDLADGDADKARDWLRTHGNSLMRYF